MVAEVPGAGVLLTRDYDAVMALFSKNSTVRDILDAKKSNQNTY
jgi:hypothetical protein